MKAPLTIEEKNLKQLDTFMIRLVCFQGSKLLLFKTQNLLMIDAKMNLSSLAKEILDIKRKIENSWTL